MTSEYLKFRDRVLHWWNNEQLLNHNKILIRHRIGKTLLSYSEIESLYFLETKPITMQQTPTKYWYCPQCECEVDNRNVTNDEKHDNCGAEVESRQHVQTPIEKMIAELDLSKFFDVNKDHELFYNTLAEMIKAEFRKYLPYEKTFHRNIADMAWDAALESILENPFSDKEIDKQTYLDQKHLL